jgi:hypothetical protein
MRSGQALLVLALLSACRDPPPGPARQTSPRPRAGSSPDVAPADSAAPARVVCAPVQGPTRAPRNLPENAEVASLDGKVALYLSMHEQHGRSVWDVELRAANEPAKSVRLPVMDMMPPEIVFRSANVIGFGRGKDRFLGTEGYVVWATQSPLGLFAKPVAWTVERAGSRIHFNDRACRIHTLDLDTGKARTGMAAACSWFRAWGDALAVGQPKIHLGHLTDIEFGARLIEPDTGKARPKPHCPHPLGTACVTFGGDLREEVDDDPPGPASSAGRAEAFEVRGPQGDYVRGEVVVPHPALSPDHAKLWRDVAGRTLALIAARVDGAVGPRLVLVDETKVSVTPLSAEGASDQRRVSELHTFVPVHTPPEDVDALLKARAKSLAASANDRVRLMDYAAAGSAHVPCTAPPP